jgi:hypothetical protein
MIYFFASTMILDPETLSEEDIEMIVGGIEEFFSFMVKNFEGAFDITYFFYRVLFFRAGFNFKDIIKMLFCLS